MRKNTEKLKKIMTPTKKPVISLPNPLTSQPLNVEIGYKFSDINGKILEKYIFDYTFPKGKSLYDCKSYLRKLIEDFSNETCESLKFFVDDQNQSK